MSKLFISDVCDTLYQSNTTTDFVRFLADERGGLMRRVGMAAIEKPWSPVFLASAVAYKGLDIDIGRKWVLAMLRGIPREELEEFAVQFVDEILSELEVDQTHQRLDQAVADGAELMLASNSIDPVIEAIARQWDALWECSMLEYDRRGRCTGRLSRDMTGAKDEFLDASIREADHVTVMTDNFSDRGLLERADERIVVLRRARDRARWKDLDAEFLEIG